jgi:peroxiredoxin Q/BCP
MLRTAGITLLIAGALCVSAAADEESEAPELPMLAEGDAAPDFEIPAHVQAGSGEGRLERLSDYRGKSVLVAFFPKVFSLGCTRQLTEYRNEYAVFQEAETEIIAISGDPQTESDRFHDQYKLPFPVVGDPDRAIIDRWGVPSRTYLGAMYAQRCVFLVDPEGVIRYVEMNYSVLRSKDALYEAVIDLAEPEPALKSDEAVRE